METKPIIRRSSQGKKLVLWKYEQGWYPHSAETKVRQGKSKMTSEIKEQMLQTAPINPEYHQEYFENFYPKKWKKFKDLLKLNQGDANNLSRYITSNKIEVVIKTLPTKKSPGQDGFTTEFYQTLKKEWTPVLLKLFHKAEREGTPPISFEEASIIPILKLDKKTIKKTIGQFLWWTYIHRFSIKFLTTIFKNTLRSYTITEFNLFRRPKVDSKCTNK